jgi:hypothetical protein
VAGQGLARLGTARRGEAGRGWAWRGLAWLGLAGLGRARQGFMAKLLLRRTLAGWEPADADAREAAKKFKLGETYRAEVVKPRNPKTLSRYWVLVGLILENSPDFESKEALHDYLKIRAGHYTPIVSKSTGEIFKVPKSIDFDTLSEDEWQDVWSKICDAVVTDILPGLTVPELNLEVQRLVGTAR